MSNPRDLHASREAQQERKRHPFREVAVVLLEDDADRFLLVRTRKLPESWQPLGGGKESTDASLIATALRELKEEAALEMAPEDLTFILETPFDFGDGRVQFFRSKLNDVGLLKLDSEEIIEHRWFTLREAATLPMFPASKSCVEKLLQG